MKYLVLKDFTTCKYVITSGGASGGASAGDVTSIPVSVYKGDVIDIEDIKMYTHRLEELPVIAMDGHNKLAIHKYPDIYKDYLDCLCDDLIHFILPDTMTPEERVILENGKLKDTVDTLQKQVKELQADVKSFKSINQRLARLEGSRLAGVISEITRNKDYNWDNANFNIEDMKPTLINDPHNIIIT